MDLQETSRSCGRAVCRQAIRELNPRHARAYIEVEEPCSDFLSLTRELTRRGLRADARAEMTLNELKQSGRIAILQVLEGETPHFVLFEGFTRSGKARIYDPALGEVKIETKRLAKAFTGNALLLARGEMAAPEEAKQPRLASIGTKVGLAVMSIIRGVCVFLLFALISDPENALGALLPLAALLLTIAGTCFILMHEHRRFTERSLLPGTNGDVSAYKEGMKAHTTELTIVEIIFDCATFIALTTLVCALQDAAKVLLFGASMITFWAVEVFARQALAKLGAAAALAEKDVVVREADEEHLKHLRRSNGRYVALAVGARALSFGLLALAVVCFSAGSEEPSISAFLSDFLLLAGSGLCLLRLVSLDRTRSQLRLSLYRLGSARACNLSATARSRGYNSRAYEQENSEKRADL